MIDYPLTKKETVVVHVLGWTLTLVSLAVIAAAASASLTLS